MPDTSRPPVPHCPAPPPGETPSVAYIAIGSNIEPETHIPAALEALSRHARITGISSFYRTLPIGRPEQPHYLNGVVRIETFTAPLALKLEVLRDIEDREGRVRRQDKFAPRSIDLDLVFYDDLVLHTSALDLPDPDIRDRAFVSVPLAELDPNLILPVTGERVAELADRDQSSDLFPEPTITHSLRERFLSHPTASPDQGAS